MPKIMIINYQQFAKTNTFSLSFHILFPPFFPKTHRNQDLGMGKNGVGPPPKSIAPVASRLFAMDTGQSTKESGKRLKLE